MIGECSIPLWLLVGEQSRKKPIRKVMDEFLHWGKLKAHPREYLHEDDEYIIITGRAERFREITEKWLKSHGIETSSLFIVDVGVASDYDSIADFLEAMAQAKAKYIKSECLDVFFEDAPFVVKRLRELCPKCRIIQIGGRRK